MSAVALPADYQGLKRGHHGFPDAFKGPKKAYAFISLRLLTDSQVQQFWAAPGMTTFLMNMELVSDNAKKLKAEGMNMASVEAQSELAYQPSYQLNPNFCSIILAIVTGSVAVFRDHLHGGAQPLKYRLNSIATAVSRKIMSWLDDPLTLACIPKDYQDESDNSPGYLMWSYFYTWFTCLLDELPSAANNGKNELTPGLPVEKAVRIVLNLISTGWKTLLSHEYILKWIKCLEQSLRTKRSAWKQFSVASRAGLCALSMKLSKV